MDRVREKILRAAIGKFGVGTQRFKAMEELAELIRALARCDDAENVAEEMADVRIMLDQLEIMFGNHDRVRQWEFKKLQRLNERTQAATVIGEEGEDPATPLRSAQDDNRRRAVRRAATVVGEEEETTGRGTTSSDPAEPGHLSMGLPSPSHWKQSTGLFPGRSTPLQGKARGTSSGPSGHLPQRGKAFGKHGGKGRREG